MDKTDVLEAVGETAADVKEELDEAEYPEDILHEVTDGLFGNLVKCKLVDEYTLEDMLETMDAVQAILQAGKERGCIVDDFGLWENISPYGVPASVAFFTLERLIRDSAGIE